MRTATIKTLYAVALLFALVALAAEVSAITDLVGGDQPSFDHRVVSAFACLGLSYLAERAGDLLDTRGDA